MSQSKLPKITGLELISLLKKDNWEEKRHAKHGVSLAKRFSDRTRVTVISKTRAVLPDGTLMGILHAKQTGIGKKGLLRLLGKFG